MMNPIDVINLVDNLREYYGTKCDNCEEEICRNCKVKTFTEQIDSIHGITVRGILREIVKIHATTVNGICGSCHGGKCNKCEVKDYLTHLNNIMQNVGDTIDERRFINDVKRRNPEKWGFNADKNSTDIVSEYSCGKIKLSYFFGTLMSATINGKEIMQYPTVQFENPYLTKEGWDMLFKEVSYEN